MTLRGSTIWLARGAYRRARRYYDRAAHIIRHFGLWVLVWRGVVWVLSPIGHLGLAHLYELDLTLPPPAARPEDDVIVSEIKETDVALLARLALTQGWPIPIGPLSGSEQESILQEKILRRLQADEVGFVAMKGEEVVSTAWVRFRTAITIFETPRVEIPLKNGEVYVHSTYAAARWRGRRIFGLLVRALVIWAQREGYHRAYTLITTDNIPSRKAFERCGYRPSGQILYFGDRSRRKVWTRVIFGMEEWRNKGLLKPGMAFSPASEHRGGSLL